ncbi:MAG: dihydrolipoyl dehydrogenase [Deltaproteobacteria bacterium]|nr:dihydrolipoyl dehydrogenase [Deltaproteobacteria bacterium]
MKNYDIAIIGGGPGGYVAAIKAAQSGKKVCLIEKGELGGVCLNQGCIPTKTLLKSVEIVNAVRRCGEFGVSGVEASQAAIKMDKLQERKRAIIKKLTGGVGFLLQGNGVKVYRGNASFMNRDTLNVNGEEIKAANIIIATGSQPAELPVPIGAGEKGKQAPIITSTEALELTEIPKTMVIIGGGVIGIEFAYIFAQLGSKVTVVEMMEHILPMVDEEITDETAKMLKALGIEIITGAKVSRIAGPSVYFEHAGTEKTAQGAKILMAVGRVPHTEGLNLETLGLKMNGRAIAVDEHLRTSVQGIYAIGDVNGMSMLAHTASMEGMIAVENILGHAFRIDYNRIPWGIYLQPELASVGLTEKQAREKYGKIKVGRFPLAANGKAAIEGETRGMIKVIIEPRYNEILGVHIYGIHATDMISESVLAMNLEATAEEITTTVHPHPTVAEIIPEAFHAALGKAIHFL